MWQASCQRGQCDQIYPLTLTTVKGITHIVLMRTRLAVLCALHGTPGQEGGGSNTAHCGDRTGLHVMYVCGGQWGLSGKCDHTWSNWKTLGTRKGGEVRVHWCEVWPKGQLHSAVRGRSWSGSFSHKLEFFFKEGLVLLNKTKLLVQYCVTCPVIFLSPLFFFIHMCLIKWWVNMQFDFRGMSLFLCVFCLKNKLSH